MPRSLAARLILGAAVWLTLAIGLGGVVLAQAFRESVERGFERRLEALLGGVVAGIDIAPGGGVAVMPPLGEPRFEQIYSGWYWQVSDGGRRAVRSRSLWDYAFKVEPAAEAGRMHTRTQSGPRGEPLLLVEQDLEFPDLDRPLHVAVAASRADIEAEIDAFNWLLALALGGLGLGLILAVLVQVRFGLRPLRRLAADLDRLRTGGARRLGGDYPTEIAPLVAATNGVLDHDEAMLERARTHVGNLAHSLKTPLAILAAESRADGDPAVIAEQTRAMAQLVERHLTRARSAASSAKAIGLRVPVAEVVDELCGMLGKIHADKGIAFERRLAPGIVFRGEREDLSEILGNLMDNACKWTRHTVRVSATGAQGGLQLAVEDDGPGLSDAEAEVAAQRGARLDENTPGSGLGLSIVTDLVALYGGTVEYRRSELGGLNVVVMLPQR